MSEWQEFELGNLISYKKGFAFKSSSYHEDGEFFIIRVSDTTDSSINIQSCMKIGKSEASSLYEYQLLTDDIIIATVGSWADNPNSIVGKVIKVPEIANGALLNQNAVRLRSNNFSIQKYLYYRLRHNDFSGYLLGNAQGSANQASITLKDIFSFQIKLPPLPEQKVISAILSSLDEKIDLLDHQNKTIEAMADTLFQQWFIEEAQEDWEEYIVSDFAEHIKNNINPSKTPDNIFYHYSLPAFDNGKKPIIDVGNNILSNKYQVVENSILVSKLNPRVSRIWPIILLDQKNAICSTEFQVIKPKKGNLLAYLYFLLRSNEAINELTMAASGTSHQRVNPQDILNIKTYLPTIALAESFSVEIMPILQKINTNLLQIQTLEKLRDTLLPKLMSGEVRVEY